MHGSGKDLPAAPSTANHNSGEGRDNKGSKLYRSGSCISAEIMGAFLVSTLMDPRSSGRRSRADLVLFLVAEVRKDCFSLGDYLHYAVL